MSTNIFTNKSLLIDTSFLVSLYLSYDSNHDRAVAFFSTIAKSKRVVKLTSLIFVEASTILSQQLDKSGFTEIVHHNIFSDREESRIFISEPFFKEVTREFLATANKNVSFVDISTALLAKRESFDVVSFDRHFKGLGQKYGFKVFP